MHSLLDREFGPSSRPPDATRHYAPAERKCFANCFDSHCGDTCRIGGLSGHCDKIAELTVYGVVVEERHHTYGAT